MKKKMAFALLFVFLFCGAIYAQTFIRNGNPADTKTGVTVTFPASKNTLYFKNGNATSEATVTSNDLTFIVTTEAGLNLTVSPAFSTGWGDFDPTTPGVSVPYYFTVVNEGNTDQTFLMTKSGISYSPGAGPWTATFYDGAIPTSEIRKTLSEDTDISFTLVITPSSVQSESPDGAEGRVTVSGSIVEGYPQVGTLTDGNGRPYYEGVQSNITEEVDYSSYVTISGMADTGILAPVMTLTRVMTVDAPVLYTGNHHDPIPGAVITYIITYSNTGAGAAKNVIIVDHIPGSTEAYHINMTGTQPNVTIEASQGNGSGWSVSYSTLTPPSFTYGNTADWTPVGIISTSENWPLPNTATYVKWEKASVAVGEGPKTLTWGVTIQ